jgi:hypothetical protein
MLVEKNDPVTMGREIKKIEKNPRPVGERWGLKWLWFRSRRGPLWCPALHKSALVQGDQIGRIFAYLLGDFLHTLGSFVKIIEVA